jgi:hypothetical protein
MVTAYRFVPPPFTWTMAGDLLGGHGVTKSWRSLSRIDADMPRASAWFSATGWIAACVDPNPPSRLREVSATSGGA